MACGAHRARRIRDPQERRAGSAPGARRAGLARRHVRVVAATAFDRGTDAIAGAGAEIARVQRQVGALAAGAAGVDPEYLSRIARSRLGQDEVGVTAGTAQRCSKARQAAAAVLNADRVVVR